MRCATKECNVWACFAPSTCQRSGSRTEKSGAGAQEDCSRRPKWCKRLLRKKTKEIWSPLRSLLMPPRNWTHRVKYCLVFGFYAGEESSQSEDSIFQGMPVPLSTALCFKDPMILCFLRIHLLWQCWKPPSFGLSSQGFNYNKQNNIPENWCGLRSSFLTCGFQSVASNLVQKKKKKKRPLGQRNGNCVSAGKQICVKIIVFVCCGLSQV